jgi:hypothetical protein
VTHWKQADVERERLLKPNEIIPTYTLRKSFSEMRGFFSFSPFKRGVLQE